MVSLLVTLDGVPAPGVAVLQGGNPARWETDVLGQAVVPVDLDVVGDLFVMASHPDARVQGVLVDPTTSERMTIALRRFDRKDNPAYVFQDPGAPGKSDVAEQCGHCHVTINEAWHDSVHRTSASNPAVTATYAGLALVEDATQCATLGGTWAPRPGPLGVVAPSCQVLPTVSEAAAGSARPHGGCADCHAPGIDGQLGGRDLFAAGERAYANGVHCDVCHRTEALDPYGGPGVAGRLRLLRPTEPPKTDTLGLWDPLTFGPDPDVASIRMGMVARDFFHEAAFCAGCHEDWQPVLVAGAAADTQRWPDGRLPIHTTFSEWKAGPMNPGAPCQSCHMPADASVANAADLQLALPADTGIIAGWHRPPGSVHRHSWNGPRRRDSRMLELAAALSLTVTRDGSTLTVAVTVRNVGPGHAIPTGEPMRSLVLLVEARCASTSLDAIGGDVVSDTGGALLGKLRGADWTRWPGAQVGDVIRVTRRPGGFRDYDGPGPFALGLLAAEQKGVPMEEAAGTRTVVAVAGDLVEFDAPLPDGDLAMLGRGVSLPSDGTAVTERAGAAGFVFAKVLVGKDGARHVPHHLAVDVASDTRLKPQASLQTVHRFAATCATPTVEARLLHRAFPPDVARARGFAVVESVMTSARVGP